MTTTEKISFNRLTIEIKITDQEARYFFKGSVDENLDVKRIPVASRRDIVFDLSGIESINSCGVREWVFLMRQFSTGIHLTLERCSVAIVDQFNIVPQTLGGARVASFYAPYYCENCDEEVTTLIESERHREDLSAKRAPRLKHHCGTELEFDALEDCYFHQIEKFFRKRVS